MTYPNVDNYHFSCWGFCWFMTLWRWLLSCVRIFCLFWGLIIIVISLIMRVDWCAIFSWLRVSCSSWRRSFFILALSRIGLNLVIVIISFSVIVICVRFVLNRQYVWQMCATRRCFLICNGHYCHYSREPIIIILMTIVIVFIDLFTLRLTYWHHQSAISTNWLWLNSYVNKIVFSINEVMLNCLSLMRSSSIIPSIQINRIIDLILLISAYCPIVIHCAK